MNTQPTYLQESIRASVAAMETPSSKALNRFAAVLPQTGNKVAPLNFHLLYGDALERLRQLSDCSIHAVVTDPPYGLTANTDISELLSHWLNGTTFVNEETGYAGTEWDNCVPGPELWREVERVLVPGGFVLAFAAARTAYLTTLSLALVGFEIRDVIHWIYRPGRPTSGDLGKTPYAKDDTSISAQVSGRRATLRPSYEPIIVARKPLEFQSTVLENSMENGVGAINHQGITGEVGRIATNLMVVHDLYCSRQKCLCDVMQESASKHATHIYPNDEIPQSCLDVPKPLKKERPISPDGTKHETVKPLALMRTLVRAISQPGQRILDPFLGSGTTAAAALLEGRNITGCEITAKYLSLIEQRIKKIQRSNPNVSMTSNLALADSSTLSDGPTHQTPMPGRTLANPQTTTFEQNEKGRKMNEEDECPRCLGQIPNNPAPGAHSGVLSRTGNATKICSDCGTQEAIEERFGTLTAQIWWATHGQVA